MATEPMTARQIRGDALRRLGVRFKSGDSAERRTDDLAKIDKLGIATADLLEAVERIEFSRQTTTYPPLADILSRCMDARSDRLTRTQLPEHTSERMMTPEELAQSRDIAALYRAGLIWCGMCRRYRDHCEQHYGTSYFGATPEQTAAARAALPAGKGQHHAPAVTDPVTTGLTLVRDELGGMF